MTSKSNLSAKSLILASGPDNPNGDEVIRTTLKEFVYEEIETQRIDLGGRTIIAILISHDPAHFDAIQKDLEARSSEANLDIAISEI